MMNEKILINAKEVDAAFVNSGYKVDDPEVKELKPGETPKSMLLVQGVTGKYGFHPQRLEENRVKVVEWLKALPQQFRETDGASILIGCDQENGAQWTGFQQIVERLFCLAVALGLAKRLSFPSDHYVIFVEKPNGQDHQPTRVPETEPKKRGFLRKLFKLV